MWFRKEPSSPAKPRPDYTPMAPPRLSGFAEAVSKTAGLITDGQGAIKRPEKTLLRKEGPPKGHAFPSEGPHGHRERMRDRLLDRGPDGIADYELIEMLLFFAQPKGDTKPIAKRLINRFGSYANTIAAPSRVLEEVPGIGRHSIAALKLVHAAALRLAQGEVMEGPVLNNWDQLMAYLNAAMARERVEHFRILFLDTKNRLIADELQGRGTINHTPVYPREVAKRALELHAASLMLVHNHPSGDPTPSMADLDMTMQIQRLLKSLDVALHDHVIVGNGKYTSLRNEGFL